jgi:hypothetical protein
VVPWPGRSRRCSSVRMRIISRVSGMTSKRQPAKASPCVMNSDTCSPQPRADTCARSSGGRGDTAEVRRRNELATLIGTLFDRPHGNAGSP